jgi:hypothetical protein
MGGGTGGGGRGAAQMTGGAAPNNLHNIALATLGAHAEGAFAPVRGVGVVGGGGLPANRHSALNSKGMPAAASADVRSASEGKSRFVQSASEGMIVYMWGREVCVRAHTHSKHQSANGDSMYAGISMRVCRQAGM